MRPSRSSPTALTDVLGRSSFSSRAMVRRGRPVSASQTHTPVAWPDTSTLPARAKSERADPGLEPQPRAAHAGDRLGRKRVVRHRGRPARSGFAPAAGPGGGAGGLAGSGRAIAPTPARNVAAAPTQCGFHLRHQNASQNRVRQSRHPRRNIRAATSSPSERSSRRPRPGPPRRPSLRKLPQRRAPSRGSRPGRRDGSRGPSTRVKATATAPAETPSSRAASACDRPSKRQRRIGPGTSSGACSPPRRARAAAVPIGVRRGFHGRLPPGAGPQPAAGFGPRIGPRGRRPRRASSPASRDRGPSRPCGRGRGRSPGRRPRRRAAGSTRRQTPRTRGPCRSTRAAKASSSRSSWRVANRSRSVRPSVRS